MIKNNICFLLLLLIIGCSYGQTIHQKDSLSICLGPKINDKKIGLWKCTDSFGQTDIVNIHNKGIIGISKTYNKKGELIVERSLVNGVENGITQYYKNNKIQFVEIYVNGVKTYSIEYHKNGYPKEFGAFVLDTIIQDVIVFDSNMNISEEIKDTQLGEVKDRLWEYYLDDGTLLKKEIYNHGVLIKVEKEY